MKQVSTPDINCINEVEQLSTTPDIGIYEVAIFSSADIGIYEVAIFSFADIGI